MTIEDVNKINQDAGPAIRRIRRKHRVTVAEIAERVGISTQAIYNYENGRRTMTHGMYIVLRYTICKIVDERYKTGVASLSAGKD